MLTQLKKKILQLALMSTYLAVRKKMAQPSTYLRSLSAIVLARDLGEKMPA